MARRGTVPTPPNWEGGSKDFHHVSQQTGRISRINEASGETHAYTDNDPGYWECPADEESY